MLTRLNEHHCFSLSAGISPAKASDDNTVQSPGKILMRVCGLRSAPKLNARTSASVADCTLSPTVPAPAFIGEAGAFCARSDDDAIAKQTSPTNTASVMLLGLQPQDLQLTFGDMSHQSIIAIVASDSRWALTVRLTRSSNLNNSPSAAIGTLDGIETCDHSAANYLKSRVFTLIESRC